MKQTTSFLTVLTILLYSCSAQTDKPEVEKDSLLTGTTTVLSDTILPAAEMEQESPDTKLLQGKWRSMDDSTNFLVFEGSHRKELSAGMKDWDDMEFVLSGKCINDSDKSNGIKEEKDRYISCADSDMCWYIVELSPTTLTLSYMARGNTMAYSRVE